MGKLNINLIYEILVYGIRDFFHIDVIAKVYKGVHILLLLDLNL